MDRGDLGMRSSYEENNYGSVLESLIVGLKPVDCVEIGVLDGYSALHIARGLKFNKEAFGVDGKLWCWDLWDDYVYNHGNQYEVQKLMDDNELSGFVKLNNGEAFETAHLIQYESVDFLHMDISNDGATLKKVMQFWSHRIKPCGMIAFEGGSEERDKIKWMINYNKIPIRDELKNNKIIENDFKYFTMTPFPSMTIFQKKGCLRCDA
jgi:predicted O-methyltransferase YrrM